MIIRTDDANTSRLSTFAFLEFRFHDKTWATIEHYILSQRAASDADRRKLEGWLFAGKVREIAKKLPSRSDWKEVRKETMRKVLEHVYTQRPDLAEALIDTGDEEILYEYPDKYWGTGKSGDGKNVYGKMLMELREDIKKHKIKIGLRSKEGVKKPWSMRVLTCELIPKTACCKTILDQLSDSDKSRITGYLRLRQINQCSACGAEGPTKLTEKWSFDDPVKKKKDSVHTQRLVDLKLLCGPCWKVVRAAGKAFKNGEIQSVYDRLISVNGYTQEQAEGFFKSMQHLRKIREENEWQLHIELLDQFKIPSEKIRQSVLAAKTESAAA